MTQLYLNQIRLDGGTQPRAEINLFTVQEYADAMAEGAVFPPVVVFYDGTNYWLADGFHRYHAKEKQETNFIDADVRQGTREDAVWFACGANATHGLRRTNADKRRAVETALGLPKGATQSDGQIARHCGVSQPTVSALRKEFEATHKIYESPARTGIDGRTINTTNIGKRPEPTTEPEPFTQTSIADYLPVDEDAPEPDGHDTDDELMEQIFAAAGATGADELDDEDDGSGDLMDESVADDMMGWGDAEDDKPPQPSARAVIPMPAPAQSGYNHATITGMIAANMRHQSETIGMPFSEYLEALNGYRDITDEVLIAWFQGADLGELDMCEFIFSKVENLFTAWRAMRAHHHRRFVDATA